MQTPPVTRRAQAPVHHLRDSLDLRHVYTVYHTRHLHKRRDYGTHSYAEVKEFRMTELMVFIAGVIVLVLALTEEP